MNKINEVNTFDAVAHTQMRREQLKRLKVAAADSNFKRSFAGNVEVAALDIAMRFCAWFFAKVVLVVNAFSRQNKHESNDIIFDMVFFKTTILGVFLISLRGEDNKGNDVGDMVEALLECVAYAKRDRGYVLTLINDAGGVDAVGNGDLRAELDRVNAQTQAVIQKVDGMYREVVTFRNVFRNVWRARS